MITGGSAGIGRAVGRAFGARGAAIGVLARGRAGLEGAARDIEEVGGRALVLEADVADAERVEAAAAGLEERFGPIDIWINNAMASVFSPVMDMRSDEYKRVTDVTYLGVVHGTLAALRRMKPRNRGVIVQVGSARLSRHPAAVGVLRREACRRRVLRFIAVRVDSRRERRAGDDGSAAGAQHPAV
jgi:NADP-dependent 3-hydroxy acid dehydrogenase YdfG